MSALSSQGGVGLAAVVPLEPADDAPIPAFTLNAEVSTLGSIWIGLIVVATGAGSRPIPTSALTMLRFVSLGVRRCLRRQTDAPGLQGVRGHGT